MQAYNINHGAGIEGLSLVRLVAPEINGARDVRVRVKAVSLNYRDLMVANGAFPSATTRAIVPSSDCAGEVVETGSSVSNLKVGDKVVASFYPDWKEGLPHSSNFKRNFGVDGDGFLREEVVLDEADWVKVDNSLSFAEASTLPCAGVTAWNALFELMELPSGSTILLEGTGGVSIAALQLAKAAGYKVIITSSSDEKLEKCSELGADFTINYRSHADWQNIVLDLTGGNGVDMVLEVGGKDTIKRSIDSTRFGGTIAMIGGVSGFSGQIDPASLIFGYKRAMGLRVGSTAMLRSLVKYVTTNDIAPVIDATFTFDEVKQAYAYLEEGRQFGKIVIKFE